MTEESKRSKTMAVGDEGEHPAVTRFRQFLRIDTKQPDPDYEPCVAFLEEQAKELGLQAQRWEKVAKKPIIILTWEGEEPSLPSIILNCHVDVVPVEEDKWDFPPFAAEKKDGKIYARGSQDMKCVGMQYLEAIRALKLKGVKALKRTFHLTFVPDEEIGGHTGMELFVDDPLFKSLNAGFALDEGLACEDSHFRVFYGERCAWWVKVRAEGPPGHGSSFVKDTATIKLHGVMQKFLDFRNEQEGLLTSGAVATIGDVTTVNLTLMNAGVQFNVIPSVAECGFDIRVTPKMDLHKFKEMIDEWTSEEGVSYEFVQNAFKNPITSIDPKENKYYGAFVKGCEESNIEFRTEIFPAATDSRYIRCAGIPAIGFSPMNNTPVLLHDHNEFLHEDVYVGGIAIYENILTAIGNVEE